MRLIYIIMSMILAEEAYAGDNQIYLGHFNRDSDNSVVFSTQLLPACANNSAGNLASVREGAPLYIGFNGEVSALFLKKIEFDGMDRGGVANYCNKFVSIGDRIRWVNITLESSSTLSGGDKFGILSTSKLPQQLWAASPDSCINLPKKEKQKSIRFVKVTCTNVSMGNGNGLVVVNRKSVMSDEAEFIKFDCSIYARKIGGWQLVLRKESEGFPCKPILDVDGDGVPEFLFGQEDGTGILYKVLPNVVNVLREFGP